MCRAKIPALLEFVEYKPVIVKNSTDDGFIETRLCHLYGRVCRINELVEKTTPVEVENQNSVKIVREQLGRIELLIALKRPDLPPAINVNRRSTTECTTRRTHNHR